MYKASLSFRRWVNNIRHAYEKVGWQLSYLQNLETSLYPVLRLKMRKPISFRYKLAQKADIHEKCSVDVRIVLLFSEVLWVNSKTTGEAKFMMVNIENTNVGNGIIISYLNIFFIFFKKEKRCRSLKNNLK